MFAVTKDVKKSRNMIPKTAKKRLPAEKKAARHAFRSRLKAADRRYGFDVGGVRPTHTKLDIT